MPVEHHTHSLHCKSRRYAQEDERQGYNCGFLGLAKAGGVDV